MQLVLEGIIIPVEAALMGVLTIVVCSNPPSTASRQCHEHHISINSSVDPFWLRYIAIW